MCSHNRAAASRKTMTADKYGLLMGANLLAMVKKKRADISH